MIFTNNSLVRRAQPKRRRRTGMKLHPWHVHKGEKNLWVERMKKKIALHAPNKRNTSQKS